MDTPQNEVAEKLQTIYASRLSKKVTVQCIPNKDELCVVVEKAQPLDRIQFMIVREAALEHGYEIEEDVDVKVPSDDLELGENIYFYPLKPYSEDKSK